MKKNKGAKVFAILALLGIGISVVGTGILYLVSQNNYQEHTVTAEQLQEMIDNQSSASGSNVVVETSATGAIEQ